MEFCPKPHGFLKFGYKTNNCIFSIAHYIHVRMTHPVCYLTSQIIWLRILTLSDFASSVIFYPYRRILKQNKWLMDYLWIKFYIELFRLKTQYGNRYSLLPYCNFYLASQQGQSHRNSIYASYCGCTVVVIITWFYCRSQENLRDQECLCQQVILR